MTRQTSQHCTDLLAGLVGVPFSPGGRDRAGLDCWGLHRLAVQLGAGVDLPGYEDLYTDTAEEAANARLIAGRMDEWVEVTARQERQLDAVLMVGSRGLPSHLGTVLVPGRMLHTYSAGSVRVDYYRRGLLKDRVIGFYRHHSLA